MEQMRIADASAYELPPEEVIFGRTTYMAEIRRRIERLASTNVPLLVSGPAGTGKEVLSRFLHARSPWRSTPFLKINCPSVPAPQPASGSPSLDFGLFGSTLDGRGRAELHQCGTLFLAEVGELRPALQTKLLRVLQDGSFGRLRERDSRIVAGRVVCTTSHSLRAEVKAGIFRSDLYYAINVLNIQLPPLAERREDIPILIQYFQSLFGKAYGRTVPALSADITRGLMEYHWPGNIREMENMIRQYSVFGSEDAIAAAITLSSKPSRGVPPDNEAISLKSLTRQAAKRIEREVMIQTLEANNWNRKKTARKLGISYRSLLYKLKDAGISRSAEGHCPLPRQLENADAMD